MSALFLYSAPIGNPTAPSLLQEGFFIPDTSWTNPQAGLIGDFLFGKRLKACRLSQVDATSATIDGISELGEFTWNILERLNLQFELGSGHFYWRWQQEGQSVTGQLKGGLIWMGSGQLILLEIEDTSFALTGQYGGWNWMAGPASLNGSPLSRDASSSMQVWQVGAALTQQISFFTPYVGIVVSRSLFTIHRLETGNSKLHSLHPLGFFGGCSLTNGSRFLLNLEWRGFFEQGLTLSGRLRF